MNEKLTTLEFSTIIKKNANIRFTMWPRLNIEMSKA